MGKLNILQHKSWHVYSAKNQELVRRDEAKAREEEEADRKRANIAESEARIALLRGKKHEEQPDAGDAEGGKETSERFNLFDDLEKKRKTTNDEYEAEKKEEEKKWNNQITSYLAGSGGTTDALPWYASNSTSKDKHPSRGEKYSTTSSSRSLADKDERLKNQLDPMAKLTSYSSNTAASSSSSSSTSSASVVARPTDPVTNHLHSSSSSSSFSSKKKKKSKKDKLLLLEETIASSSKSKSIDQLRQERIKREAEERRKAEIFLHPDRALPKLSAADKLHKSDSKFYNSQFNPDAVRRSDRSSEDRRHHRPY